MASPAAPTRNGQQQQTANWLTEAQLRQQPVGSVPYDGGQGVVRNIYLPQAGYLSHLQLVSKLGVPSALPAVTGPDANAYAQGPLQEAKVFVNSEGTLFDLDGVMSAIVGAIDLYYNQGSADFWPSPPNQFTPNPISVFNDKWLHRIPLAIQLRNMATPIGLYNTALQNLTVTAQFRFLPILTASGNPPGSGIYISSGAQPTNYAGQTDINQEYFEPIPIAQAQPPLAYVHRWTQFTVPITVTNGYVDVPLVGRSQYLRMLYFVVDGASSSTLAPNPNILTQLQLVYGVQNFPYDETVDQVTSRMRRQYGPLMRSLPPGLYTHDFLTLTHTARDWFDASQVTNLRARLTFSGAHPGSGSYIVCATEEVISLRDAGPAYAVAGG